MRLHTGLTTALMAVATFSMLLVHDLAQGQALSSKGLVSALRQGGNVIVMRHASSPMMPPDKQTANPDNVKLERQLDAAGRAGATAMGGALRDLEIPIGEVLTSPTYRALETVRFALLANPRAHEELGDGGQSMQGIAEQQAAWLRDKVSQAPSARMNTILVTHMPNLARAFPAWGAVAEGEAIILRPDGKGATELIARVKIDDWPRLPR
jgi:phosphohistidine phosphatase SixA